MIVGGENVKILSLKKTIDLSTDTIADHSSIINSRWVRVDCRQVKVQPKGGGGEHSNNGDITAW
jgi:hypothetical protein